MTVAPASKAPENCLFLHRSISAAAQIHQLQNQTTGRLSLMENFQFASKDSVRWCALSLCVLGSKVQHIKTPDNTTLKVRISGPVFNMETHTMLYLASRYVSWRRAQCYILASRYKRTWVPFRLHFDRFNALDRQIQVFVRT